MNKISNILLALIILLVDCGKDDRSGGDDDNDEVAKAVRVKNLGMRVMINFHYSDRWADPGKQTKPAAWNSLDVNGKKLPLPIIQHRF